MAAEGEWTRFVLVAADRAHPQATASALRRALGAARAARLRVVGAELARALAPALVERGSACPVDVVDAPLGGWTEAPSEGGDDVCVVVADLELVRAVGSQVLGCAEEALDVGAGSVLAIDRARDTALAPRCASLGTLDWPPVATGRSAGFPSGPSATPEPDWEPDLERP